MPPGPRSLPAGTTLPDQRQAAVDALLAGVELPIGYDPATLYAGPAATPYNLAADVYGHVTCAWIQAWGDATAAGDPVGAQAAVRALSSSHDWAGLQATTSEGDYAPAVWSLADRVAAGDRTVLDTYRQALGC